MNDNFEIKYTGLNTSEQEWDYIWEILCQCDHEFVPSLSSRNSTSQTDLSGLADRAEDPNTGTGAAGADAKPYVYFNELRRQHFILAEMEGRVIGFMSFKRDYICDVLRSFGVSNYITTVCVKPEYRGRGILKQLYDYMEKALPQQVRCNRITTRTWSGNNAQIHALEKRGYRLLKILANDRGAGIDTHYFGKVMGIDGLTNKGADSCLQD